MESGGQAEVGGLQRLRIEVKGWGNTEDVERILLHVRSLCVLEWAVVKSVKIDA